MKSKVNVKTGVTIAAGAVASGFLATEIQKQIPGTSASFVKRPLGNALIQVGLGMLSPKLIKGELGKNLATGMVVNGILTGVMGIIGASPSASGLRQATGSTFLPNVGNYKNATKQTAEKLSVKMN